MVVHLYGRVCRMDEISRTARKNGLLVVEDVRRLMERCIEV